MQGETKSVRRLLSAVRAVAYLVPLVALICGGELVFPDAMYLNVVWKNFAFRILVEVMVGLWGVLAWLDPRYRPRFSWLAVACTGFVASLAVSCAAGVDPAVSFWGNYERMEGLVGHLHLFAFFVVLGAIFDHDKLWRWFFVVTIAVCAVASGNALLQFVRAVLKSYDMYDGRPFLTEMRTEVMGKSYLRVDARLANPVFLGLFVLWHSFLAVSLAACSERRAAKWGWLALAGVFFVVMVLTGTRIAWLGGIAGGAIAASLYGAFAVDPGVRRVVRKSLALVLGVVGVLAAVGLMWPALFDQIPLVNRIFWMTHSFGPRLSVFGVAWEGFLQRPMLGWGQDNFAQLFDTIYAPELYLRELPDWWDRPHNACLNWLTAAGIPGLVAYLSLFGAAFWCLAAKTRSWPLSRRCLFAGALVGYCVFNLAQPDNLTSYILFFSMLACLHATDVAGRGVGVARPRRPAVLVLALLLSAAVVGLTIYFANVENMRATAAVARANRRTMAGDAAGMMAEFEIALRSGSIGRAEVHGQLMQQAAALIRSTDVDQSARRSVADLAIGEMDKAVLERPDNVRLRRGYGVFLQSIGSQMQAVVQLEAASQAAPRRQNLSIELAHAYLRVRREAEAAAVARSAWEQHPESGEAAIQALIIAILARDAALEEELLHVKGRTSEGVVHIDQRVVDAYVKARRLGDAVALLDPMIEAWRPQLRAGLPRRARAWERFESRAAIFLIEKKDEKAIDLINELIDLDPDYRERGTALIGKIQGKPAPRKNSPPDTGKPR